MTWQFESLNILLSDNYSRLAWQRYSALVPNLVGLDYNLHAHFFTTGPYHMVTITVAVFNELCYQFCSISLPRPFRDRRNFSKAPTCFWMSVGVLILDCQAKILNNRWDFKKILYQISKLFNIYPTGSFCHSWTMDFFVNLFQSSNLSISSDFSVSAFYHVHFSLS